MYVIEKEWITEAGFPAVVLITGIGHRCGYVGVSEEHPLFGKSYDEAHDLLSTISVHGGLTYSSQTKGEKTYPSGTQNSLWWFGFDCGHSFDGNDTETLEKYLDDESIDIHTDSTRLEAMENFKKVVDIHRAFPIPGVIVRTKEYVEQECENLANQLSAMNVFDQLLY